MDMKVRTTRIAVSLSVSLAVAASVAAGAGARIPDVEQDTGVSQARPAVVVVPDAFERAVKRSAATLRSAAPGLDAFERAAARRLERRVTATTPPWP
jgi:hypothetical protein